MRETVGYSSLGYTRFSATHGVFSDAVKIYRI